MMAGQFLGGGDGWGFGAGSAASGFGHKPSPPAPLDSIHIAAPQAPLSPTPPPGATGEVTPDLEFAVPPQVRGVKFDEFKIVFHRDPRHQDRSSRVAIDRFILVP